MDVNENIEFIVKIPKKSCPVQSSRGVGVQSGRGLGGCE